MASSFFLPFMLSLLYIEPSTNPSPNLPPFLLPLIHGIRAEFDWKWLWYQQSCSSVVSLSLSFPICANGNDVSSRVAYITFHKCGGNAFDVQSCDYAKDIEQNMTYTSLVCLLLESKELHLHHPHLLQHSCPCALMFSECLSFGSVRLRTLLLFEGAREDVCVCVLVVSFPHGIVWIKLDLE
jgi:hypothetical protein